MMDMSYFLMDVLVIVGLTFWVLLVIKNIEFILKMMFAGLITWLIIECPELIIVYLIYKWLTYEDKPLYRDMFVAF
jgi:hypothetical protein